MFVFRVDKFELFQGAEAGCDLVKSLLRLNCKESGGVQILDCPLYDQVADLLSEKHGVIVVESLTETWRRVMIRTGLL